MSPLCGAAAVFDFRQALLQLNASHTTLSPSVLRFQCWPQALAPLPRLPLSLLSLLRNPGLFGSIHLKQVAQFHSRLLQLRLAVSDGASHYPGDLIMRVTFDLVKHKDRAVA